MAAEPARAVTRAGARTPEQTLLDYCDGTGKKSKGKEKKEKERKGVNGIIPNAES